MAREVVIIVNNFNWIFNQNMLANTRPFTENYANWLQRCIHGGIICSVTLWIMMTLSLHCNIAEVTICAVNKTQNGKWSRWLNIDRTREDIITVLICIKSLCTLWFTENIAEINFSPETIHMPVSGIYGVRNWPLLCPSCKVISK